jgi:hypothetical protein
MKGVIMGALLSNDFVTSLEIMGKGMLSIFVVIILLTFIVIILGKVSKGKKKAASEEE